ncbi:MAG TPA: hypothetical protein PK089_06890 [Methanoregulaceae archaeon]|nr:hypothetical protein [Methanoregulaceae archaeon]
MIVVAARDAAPADRAGADVVCSGKDDLAVLARALAVPDREVVLTAGTFDGNAGLNAAKNRYLRPAEGVTVRGAGPGLTRLVAGQEPCRIAVDAPGVTIANLGGFGYVGLECRADRFTAVDVYITHSSDGRTFLPFGRKGGCTAAFMVWGRRGRTLRNLTFRRCTAKMSYHHGFSMNLAGASEGGGFADLLFDQCHAIRAGSGFEGRNGVPGVRDWSCGFDIPDAGDIERMTVRDCQAVDCWQDGFHLDGSWNGHRQRAVDVLFERCRAVACGQRSGTVPAELYQSGFYVQSARLVDCHAERCRKAGFLCKNQEPGGLTLIDCSDTGSAYSLVIEYGGDRARVEGFVSTGATRRALQMVGNNADVGITIRHFAGTGRPVLLGCTERLEYVDAPAHAAELERYRARGYAMAGNRIAVVTDHPGEVVEIHPPSRGTVDPGGLTVERCGTGERG